MTTRDLKSGMWVELRNGKKYLVITDIECLGKRIDYGTHEKQTIVDWNKWAIIGPDFFLSSERYNANLTHILSSKLDIMAVYYKPVNKDTYNGCDNIIWQRIDDVMVITMDEVALKFGTTKDNIRVV